MNWKKQSALFLTLVLVSNISLFAQRLTPEDIRGEWFKEDISLADGSTLYNPEIVESQFTLDFISDDSLLATYNGKSVYHRFTLEDSVIKYAGINLKIVRFEKPILEVEEVRVQDGYKPLQYKFLYKPTFDLSFVPGQYPAKNGELVYTRIPGLLEPKFINPRFTAMDFIYKEFRFPEYKKGGFVLRFVITKDGVLKGGRLMASSHPKYDQKLIQALMKTKGDWVPAKFNGENVNCEVEFNFDLGWTTSSADNSEQNKRYEAEQNKEYADYYFDTKSYKSAIYYYTQTLENNPYNIDAYYKRAACFVFRKDINSACADYESLTVLNQVKAKELFEKYCSSYESSKKE